MKTMKFMGLVAASALLTGVGLYALGYDFSALSPAEAASNGSASVATEAPASELNTALTSTVEAFAQEQGFPGMSMTVILPDGTTETVTAGFADKESGAKMSAASMMPAGSSGKTFMAAAILELVAEAGMDLDAPVANYVGDKDWYAGMPNGDAVTMRMLLNHTAGLVTSHRDHPTIAPMFKNTFGPEGRSMADQGYVNLDAAIALRESEARFPAGEGWAYSDANYILAALVAEDVCDCILLDEIVKRYIEPNGLAATMPTPRQHDAYASGYEGEAGILEGAGTKLTEGGRLYYDPELEWSGGGIASNTADLAKWAKLLFSGAAVSETLLADMVNSTSDLIPPQAGWKYGLGVQVATDDFGQRLMHGGYIPGYSTYIEYRPEANMALAIQINTRVGFGANRQFANQIWTKLAELKSE